MNEITIHGKIRTPVNRVVSLAPSITEILFYVGLGGAVVGVTHHCDYPEAAGKIRKVDPLRAMNQLRGTFIMEGENANIEIFFTLNPEKEALIQKVKMRILDKHE